MSAVRRPASCSDGWNADFPERMIESLDREARRLGVNRQSIIKAWLAERLERSAFDCVVSPDPHRNLATRRRLDSAPPVTAQ